MSNDSTWLMRKYPSNVNEIIERIKSESSVNLNDVEEELNIDSDVAVLNNTGLKAITAYVSVSKDKVLDSYVVTPSGIVYQFTIDLMSNDFHKDWWSFALRNYRVIVINADIKTYLADLVGVDSKIIKGKILRKGKNFSHLNDVSLNELFDFACPK